MGEGIGIPGTESPASKSKSSSSDNSKTPASDDRPILHRPGQNPAPAGNAPPDSTQTPSPAVTPPSPSQPATAQEDSDRPKMRRGSSASRDSQPVKADGSPATPPSQTP